MFIFVNFLPTKYLIVFLLLFWSIVGFVFLILENKNILTTVIVTVKLESYFFWYRLRKRETDKRKNNEKTERDRGRERQRQSETERELSKSLEEKCYF